MDYYQKNSVDTLDQRRETLRQFGFRFSPAIRLNQSETPLHHGILVDIFRQIQSGHIPALEVMIQAATLHAEKGVSFVPYYYHLQSTKTFIHQLQEAPSLAVLRQLDKNTLLSSHNPSIAGALESATMLSQFTNRIWSQPFLDSLPLSQAYIDALQAELQPGETPLKTLRHALAEIQPATHITQECLHSLDAHIDLLATPEIQTQLRQYLDEHSIQLQRIAQEDSELRRFSAQDRSWQEYILGKPDQLFPNAQGQNRNY